MAERIGDMAARVAEDLRREHESAVKDETALDKFDPNNVMTTTKKGIFSKVEFAWRESDKKTLDQIRAASGQMFMHLFSDAIATIDTFYASLYVAELTEYDTVRTDEKGRPIWQCDDKGNPIEDWSRLTGDDVEHCIADLARLHLRVAPEVNDLLLEAMFAKRISTDAYDDAYTAILDGTIQDRSSKANRNSRQDNYHAFFRYWLWSQGDTFLKEITNFQRVLERTRDWQVRSQWK